MREKVEQFCRQHKLLPDGSRILVACSGGADSLALLDILKQLAPSHQWQIFAAHYEHGIRGEESLADAAFVADFCRLHQIPCFVEHGQVPQAAKENGQTLEQAARSLRYAFLQRICREQKLDFIAVAHHADDQAETVLMRILRGTGIKGISAMRPASGKNACLVRPLLGQNKADILEYCHQQGLAFREDATNFAADCTRNRLRLELLPQLRKAYNPEISRVLCQLAEVAAEEEDFLQAEVDRCWSAGDYVQQDGRALVQQTAATLHPALQRGLIRRLWENTTGSALDLTYQQTESIRRLLLQGTTSSQQELSHGYTAHLAYGYLTIDQALSGGPMEKRESLPETVLDISRTTDWGRYQLVAEWRDSISLHTLPHELYLYPQNFSGELVLRTRRPGDFIQLPAGRKTLKKLMIDDKIPQAERDKIPLLAMGSEIIWMIGRRRSARCLPDVCDYHKILYLRFEERGI